MKFKKEYRADYSLCDYTGNLSLVSITEIIQNAVAANFGLMGCDNLTLRTKYNAMWVFVKNDIHITNTVKWNDSFHVEAYAISFKRLKCIVETDFISEDGELFAYSVLECCCLDTNTHKLRSLDTIPFPMDYSCPLGREYSFRGKQALDYKKVEDILIRSQDIDYSHHLNNVLYLRYALNTYSVSELLKMKINGIELYYIKEVTENTHLCISKYHEDECDSFSISNGEVEVFSMYLKYEIK